MDSSLDQKNFKFLKSNNLKGRPVIEDTNGYQYRFRRECTGANVYYKCRAVDKFKCPATGILRPNLGTFEPRSVHNHPVERARLAVENVISANIENAAKNPEIQPRNVMANIVQQTMRMSEFATGLIPSQNTIKSRLQRSRKIVLNEPALPRDVINDLESIPRDFAEINGKRFLLGNKVSL